MAACQMRVQAIREGACDYLQKPVSFEELEATAERFLIAEESVPGAFEGVGESAAFSRGGGAGATRGVDGCGRIDPGGKRHGKRTAGEADSSREHAKRRTVCSGELFGISREFAGERIIRAYARGVHGSQRNQAGEIRAGGWRNAVTG